MPPNLPDIELTGGDIPIPVVLEAQYLQMLLVNMDKVDQPIDELECKITSRIFSSSYGRTCTTVSTRSSL